MVFTVNDRRAEVTDNSGPFGPLEGRNCPSPHERDIAQWLEDTAPSSAAWVALGGHVCGPRLPAIAEPRVGAPSPGQRAYSALRMTFGGASRRVSDDWQPKRRPVAPALAAAIAAAPRVPPGHHGIAQPAREPAFALMAAFANRIEGHDSGWIHRHTLALPGDPEPAADGRERSRHAERLIRRGDALWLALGAWPWAACAEPAADWAPPLTWEWWTDPRAAGALATWRAAAVADLKRSARALEHEARQLEHDARQLRDEVRCRPDV